MEGDTDSGCEVDVQLRSRSDGLKISEDLRLRQQRGQSLVAETDNGKYLTILCFVLSPVSVPFPPLDPPPFR